MPNKMERFTQRARRVLSLAQESAESLKHNYIGTEHLLLGLMREEGGVAGQVLRALGVEQTQIESLAAELSKLPMEYMNTAIDLKLSTKKVLELAVDEARRLGHRFIGTEHLLLGMVRQSDDVAVEILKQLNVTPEAVRRQTQLILQELPSRSDVPTGESSTAVPPVESSSDSSLQAEIAQLGRFTQRARRVVSLAQEAAQELENNAINNGHLLLGLMREEGGVAGRVLRNLGVEMTQLEELLKELSPPKPDILAFPGGLSPTAKQALVLGVDEARRMGHHYIGTEHMLLGLVRQPEGVAIEILKRLNISPGEVRRQTRRILQESPLQPPPVSEVIPTKSEREGEEVIPASVTPSASYMFLMLRTLLSQIVKMVSEEQLTTAQAKDLFQSLQPQILPESEYQRIQAAAAQLGQLEGRHIRITLADKTSDAVQVEVQIPLKQLVPALDSLMNAILNNKNNWLFTDETDPKNCLEIRIEED